VGTPHRLAKILVSGWLLCDMDAELASAIAKL
jgi:hypothetical protein